MGKTVTNILLFVLMVLLAFHLRFEMLKPQAGRYEIHWEGSQMGPGDWQVRVFDTATGRLYVQSMTGSQQLGNFAQSYQAIDFPQLRQLETAFSWPGTSEDHRVASCFSQSHGDKDAFQIIALCEKERQNVTTPSR